MGERLTEIVNDTEAGWTMGRYLSEHLHLSKRLITRLKHDDDGICLNGAPATVRCVLQTGDEVSVRLTDDRISPIVPLAQKLAIIYEDDALLVVNKPAGLPIYPRFAQDTQNLASAVLAHWQAQNGSAVFRPLSRLDKGTSGLLVIAKNAYVLYQLQRATPQKDYLALVSGDLANDGIIEAPIGRSDDKRWMVRANGKYARTRYIVCKRSGDQTLLQVRLDTGRTHQIRVHFAALGYPLIGDELYGGDRRRWTEPALHAWRLSLTHPLSGERLTWQCSFERLMQIEQMTW